MLQQFCSSGATNFEPVERSLIANLSAANCCKSCHFRKDENWSLGIRSHFFHLSFPYMFSVVYGFPLYPSQILYKTHKPICTVEKAKYYYNDGFFLLVSP